MSKSGELKLTSKFDKNYTLGGHKNDNIFGSYSVLTSKLSSVPIILVTKLFTDRQELSREIELVRQRLSLTNQNVVNLLDYSIEVKKTFCSTMYNLKQYFEIPQKSLRRDIIDRKSKKPQTFYNNRDLTFLLYQIIFANVHFQEQNYVHGDINPNLIYVDKNEFKIALRGINTPIQGQNRHQKDRFIKNEPMYVSPFVYRAIKKGQLDQLKHNEYKSDVFSFGLVLLEAAIFQPIQGIYTERDIIDFEMLEGFIGMAESQYKDNVLVMSAIRKMLEEDESKRPDFLSMKKILPDYKKIVDHFQGIKSTPNSEKTFIAPQTNNFQTYSQADSNFDLFKEQESARTQKITNATFRINNNASDGLKNNHSLIFANDFQNGEMPSNSSLINIYKNQNLSQSGLLDISRDKIHSERPPTSQTKVFSTNQFEENKINFNARKNPQFNAKQVDFSQNNNRDQKFDLPLTEKKRELSNLRITRESLNNGKLYEENDFYKLNSNQLYQNPILEKNTISEKLMRKMSELDNVSQNVKVDQTFLSPDYRNSLYQKNSQPARKYSVLSQKPIENQTFYYNDKKELTPNTLRTTNSSQNLLVGAYYTNSSNQNLEVSDKPRLVSKLSENTFNPFSTMTTPYMNNKIETNPDNRFFVQNSANRQGTHADIQNSNFNDFSQKSYLGVQNSVQKRENTDLRSSQFFDFKTDNNSNYFLQEEKKVNVQVQGYSNYSQPIQTKNFGYSSFFDFK